MPSRESDYESAAEDATVRSEVSPLPTLFREVQRTQYRWNVFEIPFETDESICCHGMRHLDQDAKLW